MISNLGKQIIAEGGDIVPILIPSTGTNGMGMMNPSIVIDGKEILVNLRWVDYSFFHSEKGQKFWSRWGPLTYIHPENDLAHHCCIAKLAALLHRCRRCSYCS